MFVKSLQLNMSLTTFDAEVRTLFRCFNNNSKKVCCSQLLKLQQSSLTQINNSHWWYCKYARFHVATHKKVTWRGLVIVEATHFHVVLLLHSYQNAPATFPLLPEAYEPELHRASTINVENYHFQIGC